MYPDLKKPLRQTGSLVNAVDNLLRRNFGGPVTTGPNTGEWLPPVDVSVTKFEVIYQAEIPGLKSEELDIFIDDDVLTIHLEKKRDPQVSDTSRHQLGEKFYGSVALTVKLPSDVMVNHIDARLEKSVLTITIPKMRKSVHKEVRRKSKADIRPRAMPSKIDLVDDDFDEYGIIDLMGWSV